MPSPRLFVPVLCVILVGAAARPAAAQEPPGRGDRLPQWTVAYGGFAQLDDVAPLGPAAAWAVNAQLTPQGRAQTVFVRQDGAVWRVAQVVDGVALTAISFAGPDTGFAVGEGGQLWRWNGASWQRQAVPTTENLTDVAVAGPTAAWASGASGLVLAWDGRDWHRQDLPPDLQFTPVTSVAAPAADDAWATSLGGAVLHLDGSWQIVKTPTIVRPVQIAFDGPGHALVVGRGALELAGGTWRAIGDPNTSYRSVAWVGADAYVVVSDHLVRYRDGTWTPVTLAAGPGDLAAKHFDRVVAAGGGAWAVASDGSLAWLSDGSARYVWPPVGTLRTLDVAPGLLWAGGDAVTAGFVGFRDGALATQADPAPGSTVWDLDLRSAADGWAVSYDYAVAGTTELWRWDGTRWAQHTADKTWLLTRVQALSADEAWAGGGNVVVRWRGTDWQPLAGVPQGADGPLSILRGGDAPLGWFGSFGRVFHLLADTWSEQPVADAQGFVALQVWAEDDGWAATPTTLFHYDGQDWTPAASPKPTQAQFRDLDVVAPNDLWVLLEPPALLHRLNGVWEYHDLAPLGGDAHFTRLRVAPDVAAPAHTAIWLAGDPPTIARYQLQTPATRLYLPLSRK
jgi:hypothetical protein